MAHGIGDVKMYVVLFFFSSRRRHTRLQGDWSSDVCSSDLIELIEQNLLPEIGERKLAEFCDVFCDRGAFSVAQSKRVLQAGRRSEERRVGKEGRSRWSPDH